VYGGSNVYNVDMQSMQEPAFGMDNALTLTLPPLSTLILQPV